VWKTEVPLSLMKLLAIRLGWQMTPTKSLVIALSQNGRGDDCLLARLRERIEERVMEKNNCPGLNKLRRATPGEVDLFAAIHVSTSSTRTVLAAELPPAKLTLIWLENVRDYVEQFV
jgi:hypothetical protein